MSHARDASESGWQSLRAVTSFRRHPNALLIECRPARVRVTAERDGIIRLRLAPLGRFGRDHSWAVIDDPSPRPGWRVEEDGERIALVTDAVRVHIQRQPCRISFLSPDGEVLCADDPRKGMCWDGDEVACHKALSNDDHFFGLGEKCCPLDKRGAVLVNWNIDDSQHEPWSDPLYQTHPFLLVFNRGRSYGLFFDNVYRSWFDLGKTSASSFSFGAEGGEMDYYFIPGPTPAEVLRRYARLIGPAPLPPRWALGYHQCRWGYKTAGRIRRLARDFRRRQIPCDALWLDIDYMDGYRCFTWHPKSFSRPERLLDELSRQGLKTVVIIDPGIKHEPGYDVYDDGAAGGHFCLARQGGEYVGRVWPGDSVFPDFTRPATRAWWGELHRHLVDAGVAGIWTDMNEPADFTQPTHLVPDSLRMDNDGAPTSHRAVHNAYGMLMARATFEGLRRLRPDRRPFVLTRAGYVGVQRYAAVWTGDNLSSWEHLRMSVPMLLNMGISNIAFCGADIGGFREHPSAELYARWLQLGIFYPFCRTHSAGKPEQDPFSFGARYEKINRRTIELRYRLMPYLYTELREALRIGHPLMRPLLLDYPRHPEVHRSEYEFMFGRQLLVAPVAEAGAEARKLTLPAGRWFDFFTGRPYGDGGSARADVRPAKREAGQSEGDFVAALQASASDRPASAGACEIEVPVTIESIPVLARAGAIIPMREVTQHTDEQPIEALTLRVFPGDGTGWFYNDDGATHAHEEGDYTLEEYRQAEQPGRMVFRLVERRGVDRYAPTTYRFEFMGRRRPPATVLLDNTPLRKYRTIQAVTKTEAGWCLDRKVGVVHLRTPRLAPGQTVELTWARRHPRHK